ncbi:hypothetical protein GGX14DRAFT_393111 [Mycena pura]|uniref:Uncharacterized protein n=1 Tax=Mycena pura TaxID=153505 RepID=A0AAD6VI74_9AGAR|nr:hypothetical protein GGX14DRAFT_393111 [Mycena pura]
MAARRRDAVASQLSEICLGIWGLGTGNHGHHLIDKLECPAFHRDFSGEQRNADAGRDYFRQKFQNIAESAGRTVNEDFFIRYGDLHNISPPTKVVTSVTTATDAEAMRELLAVNSETAQNAGTYLNFLVILAIFKELNIADK